MMRRRLRSRASAVFLLYVLVAMAASPVPMAAGATQPGDQDRTAGECLTIGYVHDGAGHYSLLMNETFLMGTTLTIESSCETPLNVQVDGGQVWSGVSGLSVEMEPGYPRTVQVWSNGSLAASWVNLSVYPGISFTGTMLEINQGDAWMDGALTMTPDDLSQKQVTVALGAGIITFALVSQVLHRVVRSWTERKFVQEVVP